MSFIKNAIELVSSPNHSRTVGIIIVLFILAIVPLTVMVLQQQQEIRQRAAESCNAIRECTAEEKANSVCEQKQKDDKCRVGTNVFQCQ